MIHGELERRSSADTGPNRFFISRLQFFAALLLAGATVAAYLPAMRGDFIWDDEAMIQNNPMMWEDGGLWSLWSRPRDTSQFYPLTFTTFWLDRRLWGLNPVGYHVVNLVLHIIAVGLLYRLLRRLGVPGAGIAAGLFALHPVNVESVAWIIERKNTLSGVFFIASIHYYCESAGLFASGESRNRRRSYVWATVLLILALLSKTATVCLPGVLFLLIWWKRGRIRRDDWVFLSVPLAICAAMGGMTSWVERHGAGARGELWEIPFTERMVTAGRAVWFYVVKLLYPVNLMFIYPRLGESTTRAADYLPAVAVILSVGGLWLLRKRIGRGPIVTALCYLGCHLPTLGFIGFYFMRFSLVADRFQYMPSMAAFAFAGALISKWLGAERAGRTPLSWKTIPVAGLFVWLGIMSWNQSGLYQGPEHLWRETLRRNPTATMAHGNLADALRRQKRWDEAVSEYRRGLAAAPNWAPAHFNLAECLFRRGDVEEAAHHYREAARNDPKLAEAHNNLGFILLRQGRFAEAAASFREAIRIRPGYVDAHYFLGASLERQGLIGEAIGEYETALRLRPDDGRAGRSLEAAKNKLRGGQTP